MIRFMRMVPLVRLACVLLLCGTLGGCCGVRETVFRVEPPSTFETLCPNARRAVESFFRAAQRRDCRRLGALYPAIRQPPACRQFLEHLHRHGVKLLSLHKLGPIGGHESRNVYLYRGCQLRAVMLRRGQRTRKTISVTWSQGRPRIHFD
jgi:hypothetical protein